MVLHACADISAISRSNPVYDGLLRVPAAATGAAITQLHRHLARKYDARVVAHGEELFLKLGGAGRAIVSSSLHEREIASVPRRRPMGAPFRILYLGYLRGEKGIDVLLDAYLRVLRVMPDAELEIVGGKDPGEHGTERALRGRLAAARATGTLRLLPGQPFGPKLFQHFADADVLALPSRSEGTPRVLVEARAFGCPVVASNVGGIPDSVSHDVDGLLVSPGRVDELAGALVSIGSNSQLRARLVEAGLARVRGFTVERFAEMMWDEIERAHHAASHW